MGACAKTSPTGLDSNFDEFDLDLMAFIKSEIKINTPELNALWEAFTGHITALEDSKQEAVLAYAQRIFREENGRFSLEDVQKFVDAYSSDEDYDEPTAIKEEVRKRHSEALNRYWERKRREGTTEESRRKVEKARAQMPAIDRRLREERRNREKNE